MLLYTYTTLEYSYLIFYTTYLISFEITGIDFVHREHRSSRSALFDDLEEGGLRASASAVEIKEHDNDRALLTLEDRVSILKRVSFKQGNSP